MYAETGELHRSGMPQFRNRLSSAGTKKRDNFEQVQRLQEVKNYDKKTLIEKVPITEKIESK